MKSWQNIHKVNLDEIYGGRVSVFPPRELVYRAFELCPLEQVKVVLLGQDPYHGQGQAHGLSFSVPQGVPLPPSLKNIFKELSDDLRAPLPARTHGDLTSWAEQGVLLLNSILTVAEGQPGSHAHLGWEQLTDQVILKTSQEAAPSVFVLWGSFAHKKEPLIDAQKHLILKSVHPSPLSSYRGFFGSKPFSKANEYLQSKGRDPIHWLSVFE